ncbi:hypothetical protein [Lutimonas zeaxanthinifaciens]|uniref:hypothetical protein n=1 Tax=Lutimonas zeaxanthinifaciens TaxID=3060215 RepID=UPI00265C9D3D|nr:hypothetical protein [Lutimonas sp. YSD2104]WKK64550.1 hypothetical protein QZH61_08075 [Lutimonas sp. YSD2104]
MKIIVSEINHYWVHFQAGRTGSNLIYPKIIIKCYHDDDYVLQASFYPDNKTLPENYHDVNSKLVYLRYPVSMYANVVDLLRNEKPIYFSYSEKSKLGYIRTGKEPIGEGENDADFN